MACSIYYVYDFYVCFCDADDVTNSEVGSTTGGNHDVSVERLQADLNRIDVYHNVSAECGQADILEWSSLSSGLGLTG